jgi:class 3 adenylate cyclase
MRFCGQCGRSLAAGCPRCGAENPPGFRFCGGCGRPLEERELVRKPGDYTPRHLVEKILRSKSAIEGERKQVTVLFVDVKGSMGITEAVDPEEWHAVMDRFFQILTDGVHRFEGTVNQYTGDGVMALFGAPIAHEDHARRGCYAALHLGDELRRYANELRLRKGLNFSVRMGLNSGDVVVGKIGDDLRMDYTAQGHTVMLAARMQQVAEPGKVYLTDHTAKLVRGYFQLGDLGELALKGANGPLHVYELQGVGALRTRLDLSRARGFSRFVGRADEMQILEAALVRARESSPQIIGIVGEAGVGKSRLCFEFLERCRARGLMTHETHGVAHGKSVPLLPILRLFRGFFGITERDSDATARERIAGRLLLLDEGFRNALPLMFDFLGVPDPESPAPRIDAEARQRQLFAIVRSVIQARAGRETIVALLEDLHWFDGSSEAFLEPLLDPPPGAKTLMVLNFRPEYRADWMQKPSYQQVALQPLGPEAITELLRDLLGDHPSLERLPGLIRERTGGNPFFIEEVILSLVESGVLEGAKGAYRLVRPVGEVGIPRTVHDILAARIDRLQERDKQVLQSASVIGKKFPETVLRRIVQLPDHELGAALRFLQGAEFIYEEALYPEAEYAFKHPLTQQVALDTQLRERRARIHASVAQVIEELHQEKLDEQAALLAYHWEEAGEPLLAARWNARAAAWAGKTDPAEALRHWQKAKSLLEQTPDTPERRELELEACKGILPLCWRVGVSERETTATFERGRALAEDRGDLAALAVLHLHYGMCRSFGHADVEGFTRHVHEAAALSERIEDEALVLAVAAGLLIARWLEGRLSEGIEAGRRALERQPDDVALGSEHWGFPPYANLLCFSRLMEATAGRPSGALRDFDLPLRIAREQSSQELESYIHVAAVQVAEILGEPEAALPHGRQSVETAEKSGLPVAVVYANYCLGTAHCIAENWKDAVSCLERALAVAAGEEAAVLEEPLFLARLAEAYAGLGESRKANETVDRALVLARERKLPLNEITARWVQSRVLRRSSGAAAHEEIESTLAETEHLISVTGARSWQPFVHVERAELARLTGEEAAREGELREAQRLFAEMGAARQVERIARELES